MIIAFMLQNPQVAAAAIDSYNAPGHVDASQLQQSLADFAMTTLNCYHHTARFRGVQVLGAPWREQAKFGAEGSVVLQIDLSGMTGTNYQMIVAAMAKGSSYRTFVLNENTMVPYNKKCSLERWTTSQASQ